TPGEVGQPRVAGKLHPEVRRNGESRVEPMIMNRMRWVRSVLAAVLAAWAAHSLAQQTLEIIPLRHRTVDQVLPALQPLVEPGGALTGQSGQLIVRISPLNMVETKTRTEALDAL